MEEVRSSERNGRTIDVYAYSCRYIGTKWVKFKSKKSQIHIGVVQVVYDVVYTSRKWNEMCINEEGMEKEDGEEGRRRRMEKKDGNERWIKRMDTRRCPDLMMHIITSRHGTPKPTAKSIIKPRNVLLPLMVVRLSLLIGALVGLLVGVGSKMMDDGRLMDARGNNR